MNNMIHIVSNITSQGDAENNKEIYHCVHTCKNKSHFVRGDERQIEVNDQ